MTEQIQGSKREYPPGTFVEQIKTGGPCMPFDDAPVYVALDCPAWINGKDVLLAVLKNVPPAERRVIALFPIEARFLHAKGRLEGWTPV